jgi:tripartite-type tricarboxylate transporter receptor subunit TctC
MKTPSPLKHAAAALAFCLAAGGATLATAAYPERPVTVIVPFAAGAAADAAMRVVGRKLGDMWGQQVVVENRPGVHGMMGAATAKPDGYTLLLAAGSGIVTAPLVNKKLPYKPADFAPIGRVTTSQSALVVNQTLGVSSVAELIALAKARPGQLSYASSGQGAPNHLGMELFLLTTGTDMVHVPYRGAAPAMVDLLGNQVQLGLNAVPTVLPYLRQGKLKVLAIAGDRRSPLLPEVPTLREAGVKGLEIDVWYALFAPVATPPALLQKLSADLEATLKDPQVVEQIGKQGAEAAPLAPAGMRQLIGDDTKRWERTIRERNLKVEE